ncbi:hypothetical protein DIJ64_14670 [Mycobacterium leprae]|uniref:Uncharacterized protein n=1 Tax=Mycobacterium leprae TaxID=1769 RepID=A0AAD0P903_MYCLR|nr:hypothetical protein [Mycobacterium leprae]AWV48864.1 hypothetical protein DIJ64_14670 [Mycobacterium leprae]OAR21229.1 hypothetical protein A8144_07180 [Mycobacterium leprae 3125609]OAX71381.1 hypothetical protein A3216_06320 [Mycobacterium leprae 7935681]
MNPHDDELFSDVFVAWLLEAGHDLQRIDDYDQITKAFRTRSAGFAVQAAVSPLIAYQNPE